MKDATAAANTDVKFKVLEVSDTSTPSIVGVKDTKIHCSSEEAVVDPLNSGDIEKIHCKAVVSPNQGKIISVEISTCKAKAGGTVVFIGSDVVVKVKVSAEVAEITCEIDDDRHTSSIDQDGDDVAKESRVRVEGMEFMEVESGVGEEDYCKPHPGQMSNKLSVAINCCRVSTRIDSVKSDEEVDVVHAGNAGFPHFQSAMRKPKWLQGTLSLNPMNVQCDVSEEVNTNPSMDEHKKTHAKNGARRDGEPTDAQTGVDHTVQHTREESHSTPSNNVKALHMDVGPVSTVLGAPVVSNCVIDSGTTVIDLESDVGAPIAIAFKWVDVIDDEVWVCKTFDTAREVQSEGVAYSAKAKGMSCVISSVQLTKGGIDNA